MMALQLVLSDCEDLLSEKTVHLTYNNATTATVEYLMVRIIGQKCSLFKYMYSHKVTCSECVCVCEVTVILTMFDSFLLSLINIGPMLL